jgi:diguanylate cyclase (GGDEF)-like protein
MQSIERSSAQLSPDSTAQPASILPIDTHAQFNTIGAYSAPRYSIQQRVLLDCAKRVKSGIFVYISLWLAIGVASGMANDQPVFWLANIGIFAINALLRLWLQWNLEKWIVTRLQTAKTFFTALSFLNVLHWGVLTSLCVLLPDLQELRVPMLLAACGIAASVASVLAIHPLLRVVSPIAVVAPVVIALLVQPTGANALVAVLCSIMVIYFISAARVMYHDYWNALNNSILLEQRAQQLEELSNTDALTKIRNRLYFDVNFASEWKRACRHRWPISILIIDLDHFKQINDQHGHVFGDLCLQTVARLLQSEVQRSGDILARYGGEEFIIMLTQTGLPNAIAVAERLLKAMSEYTLYNNEHSVPVTGSIGVASAIPTLPDQGYRLINRADQALYQAKARGRNQFAVYEAPATARADL